MRRAVVLGGGIAGLLAARVLSDHAEEVAIVEPDGFGAVGGGRLGAPQSGQLHALLDMGRIQMERWWPGLARELVADGAVLGKGDAIRMYVDGVRKVTVPGNEVIGATRPLLERHLRRRTLARANVRLLGGRATGLVFDGGRVSGARYRPDSAPGTPDAEVSADLVVDATGRATRLDHWLRAGGWPRPPLERMRIDLGYATALLRRGDELPGMVVAQSLVSPAPPGMPHHPSAAMAAVEGDRWMVVVADYGDRRPGPDREEFLRLCRGALAAPFREVADHRAFDSDVAVYRMADSRRRHFPRLGRFPAGLVAVGDAVASFNPVYGQGMTCAALHASCLAAHLRSGTPKEPAWGYFARVQVVTDAAWGLSTLSDLAQPHVAGPYPRGYRLARWLGARVTQASVTDPEVGRIYLDVLNMRAHPNVLRSPTTLLKTARALCDQRAGSQG